MYYSKLDLLYDIRKDGFYPWEGAHTFESIVTAYKTVPNSLTEDEINCLVLVKDAYTVLSLVEKASQLLVSALLSVDVSSALHHAEQIIPFYEGFLTPNFSEIINMDRALKEQCTWLLYVKNIEELKSRKPDAEVPIAYNLVLSAAEHYDGIKEAFRKIYSKITSAIIPFTQNAREHLKGKAAKLDLVTHATELSLEEALKYLEEQKNDLKDAVGDYVNAMNIGKKKLYHVFWSLLQLKISKING